MSLNRLSLLMFVLAGLVVVVVAGLATGSWVVFGIALAVHLLATVLVITGTVGTVLRGGEADTRSRTLEREAHAAAGGEREGLVSELEALKRQPPRD